MKAKKKKKPVSKKTTKPKKRAATPPAVKQEETATVLPFPQLNSANIARVLSGFMTFRSTVKDLSKSLQRVENMIDNAYQMFEIASKVMSQTKQQGFPALPDEQRSPSTAEENIPVIRLPEEGSPPGFAGQAPSFNFGNILNMLQSPLFQRILSGLFGSSRPAAASYKKQKG